MKPQLFLSLLFFCLATSCTRHTPTIQTDNCFVIPQNSPSESLHVSSSVKKMPPFKNAILIDAGHGGEDFGANSVGNPKYQEKALNLSTAEMLRRYLRQLGYPVAMTREKDVFLSLEKRATIANSNQSKIFVSVHFNSAPSKEAEGIEVYYYRKEEDAKRTKESKTLAESILNNVIKSTKAKSRGVKHGNFAVIRETTMPAVLVECGFLTSPKEMQKIKDANYLKTLAWGIAQGIEEYLSKN